MEQSNFPVLFIHSPFFLSLILITSISFSINFFLTFPPYIHYEIFSLKRLRTQQSSIRYVENSPCEFLTYVETIRAQWILFFIYLFVSLSTYYLCTQGAPSPKDNSNSKNTGKPEKRGKNC